MQKREYTLAELSNGLDLTIQGDPQCVVSGISTIQDAQANHITFLVNPLYKKYLATTQAAAVILSPNEADTCPVNALISRNPYYTYAKIATYFDKRPRAKTGIHPTAFIDDECEIDASASIGAQCALGIGVKIGARVVLAPGCVIGPYSTIDADTHIDANVTLYDHTSIGKRVKIASGVVIGSDGFGNARYSQGWLKVPQLGAVIIHDDVEIGANTTIDRGAIGNTVIEQSVKLDNLIQIGHNVHIGENTAIAGCVGISGSASIGKNCLIGGMTGIAGHITVADGTIITGGTEVSKSIREPGVYSSGIGGLVTNKEWQKNSARVLRLENLMQRVKNLEATIQQLTEEKV